MTEHKKTYPWEEYYPEGIKWDTRIQPGLVHHLLKDTARKYPRNSAINFLGRRTSFAELEKMVNAFAISMQNMGIDSGAKVALLLPNCPQFVIAYYAILKMGGVVVNCNPLYTPYELEQQLIDAGATVIITLNLEKLYNKALTLKKTTKVRRLIVGDFASMLPVTQRSLFRLFKRKDIAKVTYNESIYNFNRMLQTSSCFKEVEISPEDLAVLQYTGGTTGTPKGAMLSHANVYCNAIQTGMWFTGLEEGSEKIVGVLPLFHVFAMTVVMNLAICKACEMLLYPRLDIKQLLKSITKYKPTLMPGVPTLFSSICHYHEIKRYTLSSIKMCISGGAPLNAETRESFEALTGCSLVEGYGLTETSPVATANPLFGLRKDGSIGLPLPGTVVEIRSTDGKDTSVKSGTKGEVCIKGPQVMLGYYNNAEQTKAALKSDFVHTGDIGFIDKEGYIFIVDRIKDMIITSGFNVYPREVEEEILKHPAVKEVAVKGVANERYGEVIKAFITLQKDQTLTKAQLIEFLKPSLAKYKLPGAIEIRDELPKTLIGKIDKKAL